MTQNLNTVLTIFKQHSKSVQKFRQRSKNPSTCKKHLPQNTTQLHFVALFVF